MQYIFILLRLINSLYTVNVNESLIVVVLRRKTITKFRLTQQDAFLENHTENISDWNESSRSFEIHFFEKDKHHTMAGLQVISERRMVGHKMWWSQNHWLRLHDSHLQSLIKELAGARRYTDWGLTYIICPKISCSKHCIRGQSIFSSYLMLEHLSYSWAKHYRCPVSHYNLLLSSSFSWTTWSHSGTCWCQFPKPINTEK
jgi:hypothetical protein